MSRNALYGGLFLATLVLGLLFERLWLPILQKRRAAQPILEIGPSWHAVKAGTPTMGGVALIAAVLMGYLLFLPLLLRVGMEREARLAGFVLIFALMCGGIGFLDDYCKLCNKRNQGLTASQKYFLQLVASAVLLVLYFGFGQGKTAVQLPFWGREIELGGFYYPLAFLYLTGVVNALNLTDGLDGLLSSTVAILGGFFVWYGIGTERESLIPLGLLISGAALGFLPFNRHPAKVFMGDTGSLFFGALVAGGGLVAAAPLTTLLAGGVYAVEAASVILQVAVFKLCCGKRLFRMAPLHHHFEKCGWRENGVVVLFSVFALIFALLAYAGG